MLVLILAQAVMAPIGDGRVLGHFPYGNVAPGELVEAPVGFGLHACQIRRDVLPDLTALLAAAATDPTTGGSVRGVSCHRSIERQSGVFRTGGEGDDQSRAISVAPAGYSEHTTGYAIDFAVRPSPNCPDIEACMAALPAARWLLANAPRFGFELSFPPGNRQQVKWEPWHWRWVGRTADAPGAAKARFIFAKARAAFPANPSIYPPLNIVLTGQPSPPILPPEPKKKKRRR
ncbi:M15 family metallopeptidase [Sphingomonas sp. Leaf339]|uniref:M15 family metallopeptidase n=1 Tax=Sphingomonas sp. Leaf339 TaxID=1736343 RepID=UPI0009EB9DB9|nr:M15 family metallopeptidase [Sphingomonas sp. Leaf339]